MVPSLSKDELTTIVNTTSSSSGSNITLVAGETIGGNRVVGVQADGKAYYVNQSNATCRDAIGLTTGAANIGMPVVIQTDGILTEPSWTWAASLPIWLANTGQLTQALPTTGYLFQIGTPIGPTKMRIEPQLILRIT